MAIVSSQSTRTSGRAQSYAKKGAVAISALNAAVPMFEQRLAEVRALHGKDGMQPRCAVDEDGKAVRDATGRPVPLKDAKGQTVYESKYVEAYSLVESFGHDELDPDDPTSWDTAQRLGRALAEDRFPGHPVLVATEVSGRSGCVHNHLIVGAVHPQTGKSIDSNLVTHARLALAHDRVLAEQGFEQRADMKASSAAAQQAMDKARSAVLADPASKELSPSMLRRRLAAAEGSVRLQRQNGAPASQARQERRLREFDRYRLNERDREVAAGIGTAPPKERFSEIELEARIRRTLADPRLQSWDDATAIGREHGVTVARRGQDIGYGMMLRQPDGTLAEPSRAHTRRGQRLGDGFRVADVEAAMERNAELQRATLAQQETKDPVQDLQDWLSSREYEAEFERLRHEQELARQERAGHDDAWDGSRTAIAGSPENPPQEPSIQDESEAAAPPAFRSRLREIGRSRLSESMQRRLDGLAALEEDYRDAGYQPDPAFVARIRSCGGLGRSTLEKISSRLEPGLREQLELYVDKTELKDQSYREDQRLEKAIRQDEKQHPYGRPVGQRDVRDELRHERAYHRDRHRRLEQDLGSGTLEKDTPGAQAERTPLQRRLDAARSESREANDRSRQADQDHGHGM
ncbi:relaxase/mobilization nuclease domain-containing protein [Glutamicibacter endophyticus]|uniref:relaxase/mobilization nuclease domain-containing protein n=1 Tax=Glutamicibacter endophyticus TaxID=1522174 RepID=UPI003AF060FC